MNLPVLVAGGGIGGLTLALSLHQIGVPVRVFETAPEIKPLGVGINLLPHAVRELTELGIAQDLAQVAVATRELVYATKHGQTIWAEPRGEAAGYHWPQFSIHRGTLQLKLLDALMQRIGANNFLKGHHLDGWTESDHGITAHFRSGPDGEPLPDVQGALLIGADGIHSQTRARFYPGEGPPIWNGAILWRGTTNAEPFLTGRSMIMAGHEFQKFVCYPITPPDPATGTQLINWVAERKFDKAEDWRREDWNRRGDPLEFLPYFESWQFDWLNVPQLIRNASGVFEYPMVDRDPLPAWTRGRVTLLGDAAHPMYPIGSNGASQAILDARVLAREISQRGQSHEALVAYEAERRPATSKIVLANRGNGPDQVMQTVEERAPDGFEDLSAVITAQELQAVADNYKRIAGFDKDQLNNRPPLVHHGGRVR